MSITPSPTCKPSPSSSAEGLEQFDHGLVTEVVGPAERGGVEPCVLYVRVRAEVEQETGQFDVAAPRRLVQRRLPFLLHRDVGAAECVDVETKLDEQRYRVSLPAGGGPDDQCGSLGTRPVDVFPEALDGGAIAGEGGGDQPIDTFGGGPGGALGDKPVDELGTAGQCRHLDGRSSIRGPRP